MSRDDKFSDNHSDVKNNKHEKENLFSGKNVNNVISGMIGTSATTKN